MTFLSTGTDIRNTGSDSKAMFVRERVIQSHIRCRITEVIEARFVLTFFSFFQISQKKEQMVKEGKATADDESLGQTVDGSRHMGEPGS